jgi:hypothetical protein
VYQVLDSTIEATQEITRAAMTYEENVIEREPKLQELDAAQREPAVGAEAEARQIAIELGRERAELYDLMSGGWASHIRLRLRLGPDSLVDSHESLLDAVSRWMELGSSPLDPRFGFRTKDEIKAAEDALGEIRQREGEFLAECEAWHLEAPREAEDQDAELVAAD